MRIGVDLGDTKIEAVAFGEQIASRALKDDPLAKATLLRYEDRWAGHRQR